MRYQRPALHLQVQRSARASSSITLTASGGTTYAWSPLAALSSTTGPAISASPNSSRIYTVTVTNANGCTATAGTSISVPNIGVTVSATPATACYDGSSQLAASPIGTYGLSVISPALLPISGATTGPSGDDLSGSVTLPFAFNFFGTSYSQLFTSTNGYVSFSSLTAFDNTVAGRTAQTFPSATTPNNLIALSMADLLPTASQIQYFTSGSAPNRIFVIDFTNVGSYNAGTPSGNVTGQIQLYETTNVIEIHVSSVNHGATTFPNTLGIENATGTVGLSPTGRNNVVWNASTPEAYRFSPGNFTYAWSPATN